MHLPTRGCIILLLKELLRAMMEVLRAVVLTHINLGNILLSLNLIVWH